MKFNKNGLILISMVYYFFTLKKILFNYDEIRMQKNRFFSKSNKVKLNFGDFCFFTSKEGRIELVHLSILKKNMKNFVKKRKSNIDVIREKIWYFCSPNFILQKKSKNSRMGKGKGLTERRVIRVKRNTVVFEFSGVSYYRLKQLLIRINKRLDVKFMLFFNKLTPYRVWSKSNKYLWYYHKYLL